MKLAIGYSTKDQIELTKQTFPAFADDRFDMLWCDASTGPAYNFFEDRRYECAYSEVVRGGADAAIAWKLSRALRAEQNYTHIGLLENDVLLDPDWFEPTMALFEKGKQDGLAVGAVSPRSYVDRVLIQRDGYAVMHNIGAGVIIFTREAAEIVLRSFRTHWWPNNVKTFGQISGIDLRTYAAFRGQEQFVTTDWGWEAQLASHGLASLALTPAKCQMIGQNPPLAEQGLELTSKSTEGRYNDKAFELYADNLMLIRLGERSFELPGLVYRDGRGMLFFSHQLGAINSKWQGNTRLKWSQGFGPFAYTAGPGGASLSVRISGSCSYLVSGGVAGSKVTIEDTRSGFKFAPDLPPEVGSPLSIAVPGGPLPREITCELAEGAVFYALHCDEPQMIDTTFKFDWTQLPEAL